MPAETTLFSPLTLRGLTTANRMWVSPMCMYSCEGQDGVVGEFHRVHYGARALGGAGLIIVEATAVAPEGRITPWCTGIWNDAQVDAWREVTATAQSLGSKLAVQLAHAGRKASTHRAQSGRGSVPIEEGGWQTVSATDVAFEGYATPRRLSTAEVAEVPGQFAEAAERAVRAGFAAIELHAAHGYLFHQFLSPISNDRVDEYGGDLQGRAKVLLDTIAAVRQVIPDEMPIFVRFSATDYREGGWDEAQTATVAGWAHAAGADLFDISSGGLITGVKIPSAPGYQVPLAEYVAQHQTAPVSAVGQITEAKHAAEIIAAGLVDVIMLGRASLRDPNWPLRAAAELGVAVEWPIQYERASKWPA